MPISLAHVATNFRLIGSTIYFRAWILKGCVAGSDKELTVLYGGSDMHRSYLQKLIFADEPELLSLGKISPIKVGAIAAKFNAELAFTPTHKMFSAFHGNKQRFFVPWWVSGEVSTSIDYSQQPWKKSLAGDLRRVRKYHYTHKVTRDPSDIEEYYDSMYLPLIRQSHGDSTNPMALTRMLAGLSQGGELLQTLRDQTPVAGAFFEVERGRAMARTIGVKDGDRQLIREGVISASTFNMIRYGRDRGFAVLQLGGSRAFLYDGALQAKRRLGLTLTSYNQCGHLLRIQEFSAGARRFLRHNPFIHAQGGKLWGAIFGSEGDDAVTELKTQVSKLVVPGLQGVAIYMIGATVESIKKPVAIVEVEPARQH